MIEEGLLATSSALLVPPEGSFVVFVTLVCEDGHEWVVLYLGWPVATLCANRASRARALDWSSSFVEVDPTRVFMV